MKIKKRYLAVITILLIPALWWAYQYLTRQNPLETMSGKWETTLSEHLAIADSLEIKERSTGSITTIKDVGEISKLITLIKINEVESTGLYMCPSTKEFIFREGTNELATLLYLPNLCGHTNDAVSIRLNWRYGKWPNIHALLTPESNNQFIIWLTKHQLKEK